MTRVATIPLQRTMAGAIQKSQQALATTQTQLATGKKAPDFASLGTQAVRNLSAHTLLAQQEAHSATASRVGTTLSFYDTNISSIETTGGDLSNSIISAIGTGETAGLQDSINAAFQQFRSALNASQGDVPLFGGAQTAQPFTPKDLGDIVGIDPKSAFTNDDVKASARVGDNLDVQYGVTASDLGTDMLSAFQTLAQAGTIGEKPTDAQMSALKTALNQFKSATSTVRSINAENGRRQAQLETLGTRADDRAITLKDIISTNEDADLGQVAINLAQQKTMLQASYSVFSQLSDLSLLNYLR